MRASSRVSRQRSRATAPTPPRRRRCARLELECCSAGAQHRRLGEVEQEPQAARAGESDAPPRTPVVVQPHDIGRRTFDSPAGTTSVALSMAVSRRLRPSAAFPRRTAPLWRTGRPRPPASGGRRAICLRAGSRDSRARRERQMAVVGACPPGGRVFSRRSSARSILVRWRCSRARATCPRDGSASRTPAAARHRECRRPARQRQRLPALGAGLGEQHRRWRQAVEIFADHRAVVDRRLAVQDQRRDLRQRIGTGDLGVGRSWCRPRRSRPCPSAPSWPASSSPSAHTARADWTAVSSWQGTSGRTNAGRGWLSRT